MADAESGAGACLLDAKAFGFARPNPYSPNIVISSPLACYYAKIDESKRHTPDIRIHRHNAQGVVEGVSYIRQVTPPRVGLGCDEANMQWFKMTRSGVAHRLRQVFQWRGEGYTLQRTYTPPNAIFKVKDMLRTNLLVKKDGSEVVVAAFSAVAGGGHEGTLAIAESGEELGEEFGVLVLLGVVSWLEISRRNGTARPHLREM